jgi:uncharacterized membrane protein (DUF2068 family)
MRSRLNFAFTLTCSKCAGRFTLTRRSETRVRVAKHILHAHRFRAIVSFLFWCLERVEARLGQGTSAKSEQMQAPPQRPPLVLCSIALFEAAKGLLALAAACGIISLRHTDLHAVTDAFLLRHGIDPERHYTRLFIESVAKATNHRVGEIAALGFAYALIRLAEGYGLWQGKHWAEWFAVISAGIYLPLEFQHFAHHATLLNAGVIFFNIVIVLYLAKLLNQQRAERHAASH